MVGRDENQGVIAPGRPIQDHLYALGELDRLVDVLPDEVRVPGMIDASSLDHEEEPVRVVVEDIQRR